MFSVDRAHATQSAEYAKALYKSGKTKAALDAFLTAIAIMPKVPGWHASCAKIFFETKDYALALGAISEALTLLPDAPGNWYVLHGQLLIRYNKLDQVIEAYKKAIARDDSIANWHAQLGNALGQVGEFSQAAQAYSSALKLLPDREVWVAEYEHFSKLSSQSTTVITNQRDAQWYDHAFANSSQYSQPYRDSIYYEIWTRILELINLSKAKCVLEVGCGSGQLARAIYDNFPDIQYYGFDFSKTAIKLAVQQCPTGSFEVGDALNPHLYHNRNYDLIISTEVLEHIESDLSVFKNSKAGAFFIGTVPDFHAYSHVRFFQTAKEVRNRYQVYLSNFRIEEFTIGQGRIFLFYGTVNAAD